ncbi:hypothetical protein PYX06_21365 [Citrobacter amalonaticus]|nr:hypothetical protein [Citrobacter amalonaticus]
MTFMLLSPLPAVEVSLKQCTPPAVRFEGFTEEDFAEWRGNVLLLLTGFYCDHRDKNKFIVLF